MKAYTISLVEDENGDVLLPLPDELTTGEDPWLPGDNLDWSVKNGVAYIVNHSWIQRKNKVKLDSHK